MGEFHKGAERLEHLTRGQIDGAERSEHLARGQIGGGFLQGGRRIGAPYMGVDSWGNFTRGQKDRSLLSADR